MLPITYCGTHTGRRTFICNALALDIPPHQCRQCADAVSLLKDRQLYCTTRTDKTGAARLSRNWHWQYGSIIPKRKDIRSGTWLICASSHVITYSKCVKTTDKIRNLNNASFTQEPLAQIQDVAQTITTVYRMPIEDMKKLFMASPVARINWASHVIMLNNSLPTAEYPA